jgi:MFS transporter, DHA1 family, multidrug resistance protein
LNIESWKRNLWILWAGVFLATGSYTLGVPFLPLYLIDLGVTSHVNLWAGVIFSISFLVGALMAPYWGALADKHGRRKMMIRSGLCLATVYALSAAVQDPWQLLAVRILHGFASGFVPSAIAIVSTNTPEKHIGYSLGVIQTASASGGILGPLIGGGLAHLFGMRMPFVIAASGVLLATIVTWRFVREDNHVPGKERSSVVHNIAAAWHNRPLLAVLTVNMLLQVSVMTIEPLLTLYLKDLQGEHGAALASGIVFSVGGIASILASPTWGRIGERVGYRRVLQVSLLMSGVLTACQMFTHEVWSLAVLRFVIGLLLAGAGLAVNALVVEVTQPDFRGRAFALSSSFYLTGLMIGPLLGGVLGGWFDIQTVFVFTGVILASTVLLAKYWMAVPR